MFSDILRPYFCIKSFDITILPYGDITLLLPLYVPLLFSIFTWTTANFLFVTEIFRLWKGVTDLKQRLVHLTDENLSVSDKMQHTMNR